MAYDDREARDMGMEDEMNIYDEEQTLYEPADTFGEHLGELHDEEALDTQYEEAVAEESAMDSDMAGTENAESGVRETEESFGETLNTETNPHVEDQLSDEQLSQEAEADYSEQPSTEDSNVLDQARDKFSEWRNRE